LKLSTLIRTFPSPTKKTDRSTKASTNTQEPVADTWAEPNKEVPKDRVLIYHLREVVKTREAEGTAFRLVVPSLQIALGEKIALIGQSGCGKSTLLDLLAMVLEPSEVGAFRFRPEPGAPPLDIAQHWRRRKLNHLGNLRRQRMGYVMQTGGLLPYLTVRDNITLSRRLLGMPEDGTVERLSQSLEIKRHLNKLPSFLSVGERQRVAIARALAHKPSIVIADEPTAPLDPITARKIMSLFIELVERFHITVIVASHDWNHVEKLGLRGLSHRTQQHGDLTETVVTG